MAHLHLDRLWRLAPAGRRRIMRVGVYSWLRRQTGMSKEECHISRFDKGLCEAVIQLCRQVEVGLIEGPKLPNGMKRKHYVPR